MNYQHRYREEQQSTTPRRDLADLCISDADVLTPLHNNKTIPASATQSKNRVRVRNTHIALVGGSWAFADFHVTPPLGRSMTTEPPWPQHHQLKVCYQFDRQRRTRRRISRRGNVRIGSRALEANVER